MAKGKNSRARKLNAVKDAAETDASIEPEVPAEDRVEEQHNEVDDEVNEEETVDEVDEGAEVQETDVNERPKRNNRRRKLKFKKRSNSSAPDSSRKEREQIEISGLIFLCNTATKKDCFKYHVFGFPEAKKNVVAKVKKGMKLFLFDIDRKLLYGIYKASSEGGMDLVPEAFSESERKFPAQVRFRIHKDCMPLEENDFRQAIKENYFRGSKFKSELTSEQVGKLMQLFRPLDSQGLPQPRNRRDARREPASQDTQREPASRNAPRGRPRAQHIGGTFPRGGSARHVSRPAREPFYSRDYTSLYSRERMPTELDLRTQLNYASASQVALRTQSNYASASQVALAESEAAYRHRLREAEADATRRSYTIHPTAGASAGGQRYLDELYPEQQSLIPKRPLDDPLYRGAEYQREIPYGSYGGLRNLGYPY